MAPKKDKKPKPKPTPSKVPQKVIKTVSKNSHSGSLNKKPILTTTEKVWTEKDDKAVIIQKLVRQFLSKTRLKKLKIEKMEYENKMEELERKAYLEIVKREQQENERQRKIEEEEKRKVVENKRRKKAMIEAAFEGNLSEILSVLQLVEDDDNKQDIKRDFIGQNIRKRHLLDMINCEDANQNTPISEASSGGNADLVQFLIDKGANVNCKGQFKRTPLYRAAFAGHLDVCEVLLRNGADPKIYADDAQTPLDVGSTEVVREFLLNWDYLDTEKLLKKIQLHQEKLADEKKKRIEAELNNLDLQIAKAQKEHDSAQHRLQKAYCELNKRIYEHDKAVDKGFEKIDITEKLNKLHAATGVFNELKQCIHDAEFESESARMDMDKCRDKLSLLRLQKREKQKEEGLESGEETTKPGIECHIRELEDVIFKDVGNRLEMSGKWPLVVDPTGQAATFFRYRDTNYVNALDLSQMECNKLRMSLLGALRYGKTFIIDLMEVVQAFRSCVDRLSEIQDNLMDDIINKSILSFEKYSKLIRPNDDPEYDKNRFNNLRTKKFKFILLTSNSLPPNEILDLFHPVWVRIN